MISFPNSKINLGLHIVEKRSDGYHNLETVFYPLPLVDVLEIIPAITAEGQDNIMTISGLPLPGDLQSNLCLKAWHLLKRDFPGLRSVKLHLHKKIPIGAGLGGGSADGAFTLIMLNEIFRLGLTKERLAAYALILGSDCPFFIYNSPVYAHGRGEIFSQVSLDLAPYSWLIVHPGIHIGTAQAFSRVSPVKPQIELAKAIKHPVEDWKGLIKNDFEASVFYVHPKLRDIKQWLYDAGALYASMSGSGSCFYGIFPKNLLPITNGLRDWDFHPIP